MTGDLVLELSRQIRRDVLDESRPVTDAERDAVAALVSLARLATGLDCTRRQALEFVERLIQRPCLRAALRRSTP